MDKKLAKAMYKQVDNAPARFAQAVRVIGDSNEALRNHPVAGKMFKEIEKKRRKKKK